MKTLDLQTRVYVPSRADLGTVVGSTRINDLPAVYTVRLDSGERERLAEDEVMPLRKAVERSAANVIPFPINAGGMVA